MSLMRISRSSPTWPSSTGLTGRAPLSASASATITVGNIAAQRAAGIFAHNRIECDLAPVAVFNASRTSGSISSQLAMSPTSAKVARSSAVGSNDMAGGRDSRNTKHHGSALVKI